MNQYKLGVACIINKNRKLLGVLTDGDIRRLLFKMQKPLSAIFVDDVMDYATKSFINVKPNLSLKKALLQMEQKMNLMERHISQQHMKNWTNNFLKDSLNIY